MKKQKTNNLLDFLGPHDLTTRTTLERIARQKCKVDPMEAKKIVNGLIAAGLIVETNRTGLLGETPVYQKSKRGNLDH